MDKPGTKSLQSYATSAPEQFKDELKNEPPKGKCSRSSVQKSELQTSLHSRKEQKRRLQIRTSCQRLCELLPFVNGHLDTATTLELTTKYISYLKETLPANILSEVNKAVVDNVSSLWKNIQRSQKKRKTVRLKRNTSQRAKPAPKPVAKPAPKPVAKPAPKPVAKPAPKKSHKDFVLERRSQQKNCKQVKQPSVTVTNPLMMAQMLPQTNSLTTVHATPILLDKSTVPRGQMLPVCQDQFLPASFQCVENNWINPNSALMNQTSCNVTSAMIGHTFLPQVGPDPSSSHMLWDATSGQIDPVAFPSVNFGQAYSPPEQSDVTDFIISSMEQSQIDSTLVGPSDSVSVEDFTSQLLIPPSEFQSVTSSYDDLTPANGSHSVSQALCDSRLVQESDLCSSIPLTDSQCDVVSPFWLDLLLDSSDNFCFPDANLVDILSP